MEYQQQQEKYYTNVISVVVLIKPMTIITMKKYSLFNVSSKLYEPLNRVLVLKVLYFRWNFSVGQHDLTLLPAETADCHDTAANPSQKNIVDIELKVIVPEGLVWAINKSNPNVKLWQYKFDSPIVTVWRKENTPTSKSEKGLEEVNLFDGSQWEWGSDFSSSPSIYLGMHEKQLYVQENEAFSKALSQSPQKQLQYPKIPWQPYPAISTAVSMTVKNVVQGENNSEMHSEISESQSTTALSVLYNSEYINGNGFYLYSKGQQSWNITNQCNESDPVIIVENVELPSLTEYMNDEEETPVKIIIVSLWYWWKEVVIISITTAFLLNFLLTQRLLNATTIVKDAVMPPLIVERHVEAKEEDHKAFQDVGNGVDFYSRYLTDFEQIDCLGKGGYGIVFEARNKIDDCNYAIKRIALPNSRDSRERVMREVKALAKLDHHNIVRYFNAWLECPPAGWQENHDLLWKNKQEFTSETSHSLTNTKPRNSVCIDVPQSDASSVDSAFDAFELNQTTKDDDSFIVFDTDPEGIRGHDRVINFSDDNSVSSTDISISIGAASIKPSSKQKMNHSESIVFQNSITSNKEKSKESIADKKSKLALDLEGTGVRKTTKMFLYIQMQLCQRLSLREWLKRQDRPRNSKRICNIFQQIVDAVEYVHLQGLIHRDLKPSNIFFAYDEKIKIGDFGLVTAMTEGFDEARTPSEQEDMMNLKTGLHTACVGTHLYMSPEQMNGQVYNYKVDIYSLGIILFELLTPFTTEMERVVALMNLRKAVFPKDFATHYPAEFDLLKMMLDENPNKRPTTLGIKARPPLCNSSSQNDLSANEGNKWHFELPQLSRHSSVTSSGSSESWENIS
ncbi:eukaryotic translation initiation factor 2-alpha kinase isoform X2 [Cephus cinctus]|uniref:non-specific serine/threonine protein kinase n=1 Tax=Cephus cinctus TaxID=211228 RepID=A0AAJ7BQT1_CEPCN|nr:eukaryotic translation initiation factor 2-alpha kinase isoform X2 [Cephus cinctus]